MAHSADISVKYFGDVRVYFRADADTELLVYESIYRDDITREDKEFHFYKYDLEVEGFEPEDDLSVEIPRGVEEEVCSEASELIKLYLEEAIDLSGIKFPIDTPADATKVGGYIASLGNIQAQLTRRAADLVGAVHDQEAAENFKRLLDDDVGVIVAIAEHNRLVLKRLQRSYNGGRLRNGAGGNDTTEVEEIECHNDDVEDDDEQDEENNQDLNKLLMTDDQELDDAARTGTRPKVMTTAAAATAAAAGRRPGTPLMERSAGVGEQLTSRPVPAPAASPVLGAGAGQRPQVSGAAGLQGARGRGSQRAPLEEIHDLRIDDLLISHCKNYRPDHAIPDSYAERLKYVFSVFGKKMTGNVVADQIELDEMLATVLQHKFMVVRHRQENVRRAAAAGNKEVQVLRDGTAVVRPSSGPGKRGKEPTAKSNNDLDKIDDQISSTKKFHEEIDASVQKISRDFEQMQQVNQEMYRKNMEDASEHASDKVERQQSKNGSGKQKTALNPEVVAIIEGARVRFESLNKAHAAHKDVQGANPEAVKPKDDLVTAANSSFLAGMNNGAVLNAASGAASHAQSTPKHNSSQGMISRQQAAVTAAGFNKASAPSMFTTQQQFNGNERYGALHSIPSVVAAQRQLEQQQLQLKDRSLESKSFLHSTFQGKNNDDAIRDEVIRRLEELEMPDKPYFVVPADSEHRKELHEIREIGHNLYLQLKTMFKTAMTIAAVDSMDSQQRTDAYNNLGKIESKNTKLMELRLQFSKKVVELDTAQNTMPHENVQILHDLNEVAKALGDIVVDLISRATDFLSKENVTSAPISSHDASKVEYYEFNGETSLECKNVYEFFDNHEKNFAKLKTNSAVKAAITKHHLKGIALATIPDHVDDFKDIKSILLKKFGDPYKICRAFEANHSEVGRCLSKNNAGGPEWRKLAQVSGKHISLIKRKWELTHAFRADVKQEMFHPNYVMLLSELLPPEDTYLVHSRVSEDPQKAFYLIQEIFVELFNTAHQLGARCPDSKPKRKQTAAPIDGPCLAAAGGNADGGAAGSSVSQGGGDNNGYGSGGDGGRGYRGGSGGGYGDGRGSGGNNNGNGRNHGARNNGGGGRSNGRDGNRGNRGTGYNRSNRGDNRPQITVKDHPGCIICERLQNIGKGRDHYKNHLFNVNAATGKEFSHPANCHNYLELGITGRDEFIKSINMCQYCLGDLSNHDDNKCRELGYLRRAKCTVGNCMRRVELCHEHVEVNKQRIQQKRDFLKDKNINFVMNANDRI